MINPVKTILGLSIILGAAFLGLAIYLSAFSEITVTEGEMGPYKLVYKEYIGSYKEVGAIMDDLYLDLFVEGIKTSRQMGIYKDDPAFVAEEKLRSTVGVIIESVDYKKIEEIKEKYNILDLKKIDSFIIEFPYKNKLSILVGTYKVYPVINEYMTIHGYKKTEIMELYDIPNSKIYYYGKIIK